MNGFNIAAVIKSGAIAIAISSVVYIAYFCAWAASSRLQDLAVFPPFGIPMAGRERLWRIHSVIIHISLLCVSILGTCLVLLPLLNIKSEGWLRLLLGLILLLSVIGFFSAVILTLWLVNTTRSDSEQPLSESDDAARGQRELNWPRRMAHTDSRSSRYSGRGRYGRGRYDCVEARALAAFTAGIREISVPYRFGVLLSGSLATLLMGVIAAFVVFWSLSTTVSVNLRFMWPLVAILGAFFLWVAGLLLWLAVRRVPAVRIDRDGVFIMPVPGISTTVRWEDISGVQPISEASFSNLIIAIKNANDIPHTLIKWLLVASPTIGGLGVGGSGIGDELADSYGVLQTYAQDYGFPGPLDRPLGRVVSTGENSLGDGLV